MALVAQRRSADAELATLRSEVQELRAGVKGLDRSFGRAGAKLSEAAAREIGAAGALEPVNAGPARAARQEGTEETEEQREAREQQLIAEAKEKETLLFQKLDRAVEQAPADSKRGTELRTQLKDLEAGMKGLSVEAVACTSTLCRTEVAFVQGVQPQATKSVARKLVSGSAGLLMTVLDDKRVRYYVAAAGHPLPALDP